MNALIVLSITFSTLLFFSLVSLFNFFVGGAGGVCGGGEVGYVCMCMSGCNVCVCACTFVHVAGSS